ncbi:MAG: acyl carrier protein [Actinomycetia bacterium]|nr:acyl carrier protein [Actinomycetes bacterium]
MEEKDIRAKLTKMLKEIEEEEFEDEEPKEITDDAHFFKDLELDSMMLLNLGAEIEQEFDIEIPEEEYQSMISISETAKLVKKLLG